MQDTSDVPASWQSRFEFFQAHGLPSSSTQARAAYKALPFRTRLRINSNGPAFFFGPIYFFVKGMWRKGLTLLIIGIALGVGMWAVDLSDSLSRAISVGYAAAMMSVANYAYYLHVAEHSRSWNPLEGFSRRAR